jgi:CRP-like cAMP-binding protein
MIINLMRRRLERTVSLALMEEQAIASLPRVMKTVRVGENIYEQGAQPAFVGCVVSGVVCRYTMVSSGQRQILAFLIPGDIGMQTLFTDELDYAIGAVTPATVALVPREPFRQLLEQHPRLALALWRYSFVEAAIYRKWLAVIGRRSAYSRIAHLLCEFVLRMKAAGLSDGTTCEIPLTQIDIADALGLSQVHVNRTVGQLKDGLITWQDQVVTINDWAGLKKAGEFDPGYLELGDIG